MDNQMIVRGRSVLARSVFAMSLVAVAAAALSPDWVAALKAQGYYGNVDLGVTLLPSQTPRAGETADFLVTVRNNGPDAANRVRTIAGARNLDLLATSGCAADPYGYPQCALPSPLAAGGSADYLLRMKVPPAARGNLLLSVTATSDDDEIAPGDEVALFKAPIVAELDLQTSVTCSHALFPNPAGRVVCDIEVRNAGPSTALQPSYSFSVWFSYGATWRCESTRPGLCPPPAYSTGYGLTPASIEPGDVVHIRTEIAAADQFANVPVQLGGGAWVVTEADTNSSNNRIEKAFDVRLFSDGFDPRPGNTQRE